MEDIFVVVPTLNPNIEIFKKFLDNLLESTKNVLVYDDGCNKEYDSLIHNVMQMSDTKSIIEYLTDLGFDTTSLLVLTLNICSDSKRIYAPTQ